MCIKEILNLFKRKEIVVIGEPPPQHTLTIPHLEESVDPTRTVGNVDVIGTIEKFYTDWEVPETYQGFWDTVKIKIDPDFPLIAGTAGNTVTFQPPWFNCGVIAHEFGHISWDLLTHIQREEFFYLLRIHISTDPLVELWSKYRFYWQVNNNEAHSELYRYLGQFMPLELKKYFPKLL